MQNDNRVIELLSEISSKLGRLLGVLAANGKSQDEQIRILREMEHDWQSIGTIVGLKPDAARKRYERG